MSDNPSTESTIASEVIAEADVEEKADTKDVVSEQKGDKGKKDRRVRHQKPIRTFPQYNIEESLEIAKAIAKHNAGNPWSTEQIAAVVGLSVTNSNFFYLTSSSRDYGFTIGTSRSKTIELTTLGRKIAFPESPSDEKENVVNAFLNIDLFKKVTEYYNNGVLPEEKYLFNTLKETFNVDPSFHQDFLEIYKQNLAYLNKMDAAPLTKVKSIGKSTVKATNLPEGTTANPANTIFVIMPFTEKTDRYPRGYFDEVFSSLIVPASADAGFTAKTAKRTGSDIIHSTIISDIYNSDTLLADLTEHNPNVLFELGLAIAFKKKVAIIRSKGTSAIFDVDNLMRVFEYDPNLWKSTIERDIPNLSKHIESTKELEGSMYLDILLKK